MVSVGLRLNRSLLLLELLVDVVGESDFFDILPLRPSDNILTLCLSRSSLSVWSYSFGVKTAVEGSKGLPRDVKRLLHICKRIVG